MDFKFLDNISATGPGTAYDIAQMSDESVNKTVQIFGASGSANWTAIVELQVSLFKNPTEAQWLLARSFELDQSTVTDGQAMNGNWLLYRGYVRSLTGTGTVVSGIMKASK